MSKYHAKKITINGITYDSKKESVRHGELMFLERAEIIKDLQRQVKFVLIPAQREPDTGKLIERECSYIADFVYTENGKTIVEDVKGFKTPDYIIKRKLMLWVHGIKIHET